MAIKDVKLPKKYKNGKVLFEENLDAWRAATEAAFATIKKNFVQIAKDSFTAGYDYKNNGVAQKPLSLEDRLDDLVSGGAPFPGTISNTFTINTDGFSATLDTVNLTANRTFLFPDKNGTFALLEADQTFTGVNIFNGITTLTNDTSIAATKKLFLDGAGDTYIFEQAANVIQLVAGGTAIAEFRSGGLLMQAAQDVIIVGAQKLRLDGSAAGDTYIQESAANVLQFTVGGNSSLTINSSGQLVSSLAIGTAPFSITSTTKVTNLNADLLDDLSSTAFTQKAVAEQVTANWAFDSAINLNRSGAVGYSIDNTVASIKLVNPSGTVFFNNTPEFGPSPDNTIALGSNTNRWTEVWAVNGAIQTSDLRDKKKIEVSDLGLDFIKKLNPVSYHWKEKDNGKHYGFLAQELKTALGEKEFSGLQGSEETSYGLNYSELIAPIIKAIQELSKEVENPKKDSQ